MPGKLKRNDYDLVDEAHDGKVPVHNEDAFQHGLRFKVKYIGTKEIYKPSSRAEIVTAMRKIRYEYKIEGVKKDKTEMSVSLGGIKVIHKKYKGGRIVKRKKEFIETVMLSHVISRVFYVSHDSQDLQIFSYIAKEGDIFKCSVFKAVNKDQAMHIVRTIGQAFEVCHKQTTQHTDDVVSSEEALTVDRQRGDGDSGAADKVHDLELTEEAVTADKTDGGDEQVSQELVDYKDQLQAVDDKSIALSMAGVLTLQELERIYQQQLEHRKQETLAAAAQVKLLTTKLEAESSARVDAQKQVEVLLKQNKELIITVQHLVNQMQVHGHGEIPQKADSTEGHGAQQTNASSSSSSPQTGQGSGKSSSPTKQHLAPPIFPHIPPPSKTPSPDFSSRTNGSGLSLHSTLKDTSSDSLAHRSTSYTTTTGGTTPVFNLSSSELDMVEPRQEPVPQEFLKFVFDNSSRSEYFEANSDQSNDFGRY